jgi:hypothetical protein
MRQALLWFLVYDLLKAAEIQAKACTCTVSSQGDAINSEQRLVDKMSKNMMHKKCANFTGGKYDMTEFSANICYLNKVGHFV